jgi:hypothetical protein
MAPPRMVSPDVEDTGDQRVGSPRVCQRAGFVWLAGCGGRLRDGSPRVLRRASCTWLASCFSQLRGGSPRVRQWRLSRNLDLRHIDGAGLR